LLRAHSANPHRTAHSAQRRQCEETEKRSVHTIHTTAERAVRRVITIDVNGTGRAVPLRNARAFEAADSVSARAAVLTGLRAALIDVRLTLCARIAGRTAARIRIHCIGTAAAVATGKGRAFLFISSTGGRASESDTSPGRWMGAGQTSESACVRVHRCRCRTKRRKSLRDRCR
jgi:hypothetical protein